MPPWCPRHQPGPTGRLRRGYSGKNLGTERAFVTVQGRARRQVPGAASCLRTSPPPPGGRARGRDLQLTRGGSARSRAVSLDTCIIRSHYDRAASRAPTGKTPGPDAIVNELIKRLPEAVHTLLYTQFKILAKHNYTPNMWCQHAPCLLYKKRPLITMPTIG